MGSLPIIEGILMTTPTFSLDRLTAKQIKINHSPAIVKSTPIPVERVVFRAANRSPIESPPASKKPLMKGGHISRIEPAHGKENRSILKRSGSVGSREGMGSVGSSGGLGRGGRRVGFEPNVRVIHFDSNDQIRCEDADLNAEPRDRKLFLNRSKSDPPEESCYLVIREPDRPLPLPASDTRIHPSQEQQSIDFKFFEDENRRLRIKFTLTLGPGVSASDVLVKANMTGNKVRVIARRTVGGLSEEFNERYVLPMEVDPYMITARLDNSGHLFVEAPVLSAERRKALTSDKQSGNSFTL